MIEEHEIIRSEGNRLTIVLMNVNEAGSLRYQLLVKVEKGLFCGSEAFYLERDYLLSLLNKVRGMYETLTGQCEIKDQFEEPFIVFTVGKYGHLSVSGQFGEKNNGTYLIFYLTSDQTVLPLLISALQSIISY